MPNNRLDPMREVAARVVADNPEIKREMQALIKAMLRDARHVMRNGSPAERQSLFRAVMPQLLRSMQGADANESEAEDRKAHDRMMRMLRGEDDG